MHTSANDLTSLGKAEAGTDSTAICEKTLFDQRRRHAVADDLQEAGHRVVQVVEVGVHGRHLLSLAQTTTPSGRGTSSPACRGQPIETCPARSCEA